jgi:hypothetical protein
VGFFSKIVKRHGPIPASATEPSPAPSETIISKEDADRIFSMTKPQWEGYARKVQYPKDWTIRLSEQETGNVLMAFNTKGAYGLSVQPLYGDDTSPPDLLIVGSYYPVGSLPAFTKKFKNNVEAAALRDLGPSYSVSARYTKLPPLETFEGIELTVTRSDS